MQIIDGVPVWGEPQETAVAQMKNIQKDADAVALMADHHLGYSMPIGGVAAYKNHVSPSGVGYDIACGNKAVLLDSNAEYVVKHLPEIMDEVFHEIVFGVGGVNKYEVDDLLFYNDDAWNIPFIKELEELARKQLGTTGSGNHYVDIFLDEEDRVWVGCHFGSRGLGHKIATHYVKAGGGSQGMDADATLLHADSELGKEYISAMKLAGRYAYAGRDWVCQMVADLLGASIIKEVHNNHNFAWREPHQQISGTMEHYWVVRKGATPAWPTQEGFIGGSMGDISVIVEGVVDGAGQYQALYSTVHGAGRVMSRTQAAGKRKRWKKNPDGTRSNEKTKGSRGEVSWDMVNDWLDNYSIAIPCRLELRGAGRDEAPHCYKRLPGVLHAHRNSIAITHTLRPIGVAMAGDGE